MVTPGRITAPEPMLARRRKRVGITTQSASPIGLPSAVSAEAFSARSDQITLRVSFGSVPAALVVTRLLFDWLLAKEWRPQSGS